MGAYDDHGSVCACFVEEMLQRLALRDVAGAKSFQDQAAETAGQDVFEKVELDTGENFQDGNFLRPEGADPEAAARLEQQVLLEDDFYPGFGQGRVIG